jgi:hypothetical protein
VILMADADRWFVYFRCWPGFSDGFPYSEFEDLSDEDLIPALWSALDRELNEREPELRETWERRNALRRTSLREQARRVLGPPARGTRHGRSTASEEMPAFHSQSRDPSEFRRLAQYVGWRKPFSAETPWIVSPRIWLADVPSAEAASGLASRLALVAHTGSEVEQTEHKYLNIRYRSIAGTELTAEGRAHAAADVQMLSEGVLHSDLSRLSRSRLPLVAAFLTAWSGHEDSLTCAHSDDFRSVLWYGEQFNFTAAQAKAIELLWTHYERGTPEVAGDTLLNTVDSKSPPDRVDVLFRGNKAWKRMVFSGTTKGALRLCGP